MPRRAPHIVVVDDEQEMLDAVAEYLEMREFRVSTATCGDEMWAILARDPADAILLDLAMPGEDGIALTRELRRQSDVGIIIVTAHGGSEDRVLGLESGADDYVVKPFNFRELMARLRSVLRRATSRAGGGEQDRSIAIGRCRYDPAARVMSTLDGALIEMSQGDLDLLDALLDSPNAPLSRDELLEKSANRSWEPFDRSVDTRVTRLRKKIEPDPTRPTVIRTVRGVGYMLRLDKEASD